MFLFCKRKRCSLIIKILTLCVVIVFIKESETALPHASQQGILRAFRSYADVTLFHFSVPPDLVRATWEFVAFRDSAECPARDVHIYLQHGSYPVISADNASFPAHLYTHRTSLYSTNTKATYHGLSHRQGFEHRRAVIPVYSPLPGDWFVAAFLPSWDQHVTQQGLGHRCHYSLFSVVLWSADVPVQHVTPGSPVSLVTRSASSYFKFYVPEGAQHLSVRVSQCQQLVHTFNSTSCLSRLALRASALPLSHLHGVEEDPYLVLGHSDVTEWLDLLEGGVATLNESLPSSGTYHYVLVQSVAQARFTMEVDIQECDGFDVRNGWAKLLNSDIVRRSNTSSTLISTVNITLQPTLSNSGINNENLSALNDEIYTHSPIPFIVTTSLPENNTTLNNPEMSKVNITSPENNTLTQVTLNLSDQVDNVTLSSLVNETENATLNGADDKCSMPGEKCVRTFQLTRIQHSQDFSSTFLLQVDEFFITSLLLPDWEPVLVRLDIKPFLDIGGSLSVGLQLDTMLLSFLPRSHELRVIACLRKSRPPPLPASQSLRCPPELQLILSSKARESLESVIVIPFPEPGPWYLALQAACVDNHTRVACVPEELGLDLDVRIQPCVFAGDPCGAKGQCERTHHGLHTFSSCLCFGGFSGWGCNDGLRAHTRGIMGSVALTLSNVALLPAVCVAVRRRVLAEALLYLATAVCSALYHACDEAPLALCLAKYEVLQFCDFFCSILAFWVTLISLAALPARLASLAHMVGVLIVAVGVEWDRTALVVFLVPLALGVLVPALACCARTYQAGTCTVSRTQLLRRLPGIILASLGLALFALVETQDNYQYVHSLWHVLMGMSLLFLLPEQGTSQRPAGHAPLLDNSCQELADVSECPPVFVLPTQLLITSQS